MKKIYFLFLAVLAISTFSCSKDDAAPAQENTPAPASLEGQWRFNKIDYSPVGGVVDYPYNNTGCSKNFLELKVNGITNEGTYAGSSCDLELYVGSWTKNGNVVTVNSENTQTVYTLVSVTATELRLKEGNNTTYILTRS